MKSAALRTLSEFLVVILAFGFSFSAHAQEMDSVLGVAHAGGKYWHLGGDYLNEGAPQIGKQFGSLLKYYQEMLSIMAPPIVAAFLLGIFWKRANATGAFVGLLAGIGFGVLNLVIKIKTGGSLFGEMHFLLTVPFYLCWSLFVMVVGSLCTAPPPAVKIDGYTWSLAEYRAETVALKEKPLKDNYRFWSVLLLALCLVTLIAFW